MSPDPTEAQKAIYRQAFVRNCFNLLLQGYARLTPDDLKNAEEPHITGEIIRSISDVLEADNAESWMQNFDVLDDPPQNIAGRFGKRRPRIDIEFVLVLRGPRPRFHIEAKRLYHTGSVNDYFGKDGLEMFITGVYAARETSAGMLGYVQTEDNNSWMRRLTTGFAHRASQLQVCEAFQAATEYQGIAAVHISGHERTPRTLGRIGIYHLLLEFL